MGCFNTRGFLSHTTIICGDEIVAFVCKFDNKKNGRYFYNPFDAFTPIMLPVYGRYNDYGGLDDIVEDDNYKWIKEHIGDMKDIVECARDCMDIWGGGSIRAEIDSDNPYHPEKKSRYILDNLLKCQMWDTDGIAILYEHKEIYETWTYSYKDEVDDCNDIDSIINYNQEYRNSPLIIPRVQRYDVDFLKRNMGELHKLHAFCCFLMEENLPMRTQCCGDTQNTSYKKDIAICKRTLEFLEKKQAEYDELYGEDDWEDDEGDWDDN